MASCKLFEGQGLASTMDTSLNNLTDSRDGFFASKEESLSDKIDDLDVSIERQEGRLESTEMEYLRRFAAMEGALAQMNAQSDFFSHQKTISQSP